MDLRKWRVVRFDEAKKLTVVEDAFWTEKAAGDAAAFMNRQFSPMESLRVTFQGSMYFPATTVQIRTLQRQVVVENATTTLTRDTTE